MQVNQQKCVKHQDASNAYRMNDIINTMPTSWGSLLAFTATVVTLETTITA
jgi:hypothetical protein